ncbi:hypothetical protein VHUM_01001 [Vanrija humicola]|uniref:Uncharacterized protein n=1 Tax=Vanrija humicola TaxID=5417 RepID=A0A7D8Z6Q9_VANHU|nr:hypothetical protein VHUM_01001 [Vanrija humicola]
MSTHAGNAGSSSVSISSLNSQLLAHGYAKRPLNLSALSDNEQANVSYVVSELLGASVANLSLVEDLNARYRTLEFEFGRERKAREKAERLNVKLETDLEGYKARRGEVERRLALEERKTEALRQDVAQGRKALETVRVAAQQEAKRSQLKLEKTLGQLARQSPIAPPSFELMNPVPPGATAPVAPGALPLLETTLQELQDIRENLQTETEAFRTIIVSTSNALNDALAAGPGRVQQVAGPAAHPRIADAKLRALVGDVHAALVSGVSPPMRDGSGETEAEAEEAEARRRAARERERIEADLRDRVKDLEVEIAIVQGREAEAKKVVEEMAKLNVGASVPKTTDFEDARLRDELLRQKRLLDAEREELRAQAVALSEERVAFDAARDAHAREQALVAVEVTTETGGEVTELTLAELAAPVEEPESAPPAAVSTTPPRKTAQHRYAPHSPSPMSPHAGASPRRTPQRKHVVAKRRGPKTPLARLVLERAARSSEGGRSSSSSGSSSKNPFGRDSVLGESRRPNAPSEQHAQRKVSGSKSSLTAPTAATLARSQAKLAASGAAPREAKASASRAWR